jgi:UPF0755 protein
MENKKGSAGNQKKTIVIVIVLFIIGAAVYYGANYYFKYFSPNVNAGHEYLYIRTGSSFNDVYQTLKQEDILKDSTSFLWAAQKMNYTNKVKPGRYRLHPELTNRKLINMLKSGSQEPVKLSFQNLRLKEQFAGFVGKKIEPDSVKLIHLLDSEAFVNQYGFTTENVYTMFLPNSYQLFWNTSPEKFFKKMYESYHQFWTQERLQKASDIGLKPTEVSILAAIVDAEALHDSEMPTIAGLYLNRLKKGMKLESDPTVIFAKNDFTIKRVLSRYLTFDSPYNTYLHSGLPPGPIMMPSINAINAVLDAKKTSYLYMCAKEDFSGYHNFATTMADHLVNAHKFQQALNERNIKK